MCCRCLSKTARATIGREGRSKPRGPGRVVRSRSARHALLLSQPMRRRVPPRISRHVQRRAPPGMPLRRHTSRVTRVRLALTLKGRSRTVDRWRSARRSDLAAISARQAASGCGAITRKPRLRMWNSTGQFPISSPSTSTGTAVSLVTRSQVVWKYSTSGDVICGRRMTSCM